MGKARYFEGWGALTGPDEHSDEARAAGTGGLATYRTPLAYANGASPEINALPRCSFSTVNLLKVLYWTPLNE